MAFDPVVTSSSIFARGVLVLTTLVNFLSALENAGKQFPHDFNYLINHPALCNSSQAIKLLIMVHTASDHYESRLTVRHTWGSVVKRKDVRLLFLLGFPADEELQQHIFHEDGTFGDIIQEDFRDSYYNLTLKTIMMVKWATTYCPRAHFVLKVDDDCFLNPDKLFGFLEEELKEVAVYGHIWHAHRPIRRRSSKWYMPSKLYPKRFYPDFSAGPSYMLTKRAVALLYAAALTTKPLYLEDVFLTGICALKANVPRINAPGFCLQSRALKNVDMLRKEVLTSHDFQTHQLQTLWWLLHDTRGSEEPLAIADLR